MLRYGVIGIKGIGQYHLKWASKHPQVQVTAIVDLDFAEAKTQAEKHQATAYTDYQKMLSESVVDVVSIAVPHNLLAAIALNCLKAGCHVLLEKPLARHIAEAEEILKLAKEKKLKVGIAYQYRTFATPQTLKKIISSGQIGDIKHIIWTWHELRPQSYYELAEWRRTWKGAGGGLIMNQISHDLDLLRWLVGEEIDSVSAYLTNHAHQTKMDDALSGSIQFSNGTLGTITASINHTVGHNTRQIIGTKGLIVLPKAKSLAHNPNDTILLGIYNKPMQIAVDTFIDHHQQLGITWHKLQSHLQDKQRFSQAWIKDKADQILRKFNRSEQVFLPTTGHGRIVWDFVDSIEQQRDSLICGEDAYKTLELINALILSSIKKEQINLPLAPSDYLPVYEALVKEEISFKH